MLFWVQKNHIDALLSLRVWDSTARSPPGSTDLHLPSKYWAENQAASTNCIAIAAFYIAAS